MQMYAPRTGRPLLFGPINTPHPLAHFTLNPPLNPSGAPKLRKSFLVRFCEFKTNGVEILEVSLQGGNASLPSSLIMSLCYSPVLLAYIRCTIHRVQLYFLLVDVQWGTTVCPHYRQRHTSNVSTYVCTKRLEHTSANPSVRPVQKSNSPKCPSSQS